MATFNYQINTDLLAEKINQASLRVSETTEAITSMQSAMVKADAEAAEKVCTSINKGFYSLIRSQISQKTSDSQTEIDSCKIRLEQPRKMLLRIKDQIRKEYIALCDKYKNIFGYLNKKSEEELIQTAHPVIDFVSNAFEKKFNRIKQSAPFPVIFQESLITPEQIKTVLLKEKTQQTIDSIKQFLEEMKKQKEQADPLLINEYIEIEKPIRIPVLIYECNHDSSGYSVEVIVPEEGLSSLAVSAIKMKMYAELYGLEWKPAATPSPEVTAEFSKLLSSSPGHDRIKKTAFNLFTSNTCQTF